MYNTFTYNLLPFNAVIGAVVPVAPVIVTTPIFLSQNDADSIHLANNPNVVSLGQNEETIYLG